MKTEQDILTKYKELIEEYPDDMDTVQDKIICYIEELYYKSSKNNIIEE